MEKEIYTFKLIIENDFDGIELGSVIYAPNGREGIIEEITSVKFVDYSKVEVTGEAKLMKVR
jgi:hypothetical protein